MAATRPWALAAALSALLARFPPAAPEARADYDVNVSLDTAPLVGQAAGPFQIDFQFNDGSGTGDGNNQAVLSAFTFGTGSPTGSPTYTGNATGDLSSSVSFSDTSFFNEFSQGFSPGAVLAFHIHLTTNLDANHVPDELTFAILDKTGAEIPTTDPSGANSLLTADVPGPNVTFQAYGSPAFNLPPPTIRGVPEPASLALLALGLAGSAFLRRRPPASGSPGPGAHAAGR